MLLAPETTLKGPAIYTRRSRDTWPNHSRKAGTGQVAPPIVAGGKVDPWLLYVQERGKGKSIRDLLQSNNGCLSNPAYYHKQGLKQVQWETANGGH